MFEEVCLYRPSHGSAHPGEAKNHHGDHFGAKSDGKWGDELSYRCFDKVVMLL